MNYFKRIVSFLLVLLFIFLTSCGKTANIDGFDESSGSVLELVSINKGTYTFCNKRENKYLSYSNKTLTLSDTPVNWKLEHAASGFYVYADGTELLLDIDNAYLASGNTIKIWERTGYSVQMWRVVVNTNGTCSFISCADEQYCLGFENGKAVLQLRDSNNSAQEWEATTVTDTSPKEYVEYISQQNIIELRLPLNITDVISDSRLNKWVNDLEKAYFTFYDLTGYMPYEVVIIEAYKPITKYENVLGYVYDGVNIIHIDGNFIRDDLSKMTKRVNDWNFCVLHEMGHMFDSQRPWNFESELFTDMKISYVLEQNNAGAELSEFGDGDVRYGKDIMKSYKLLSGNLSAKYEIFACCYKFMQIKEEIGWEPFKSTFHKLQKDEVKYRNISKREKLDLFVNTLSDYSGKDIKGYFTASEWNSIVEKTKE